MLGLAYAMIMATGWFLVLTATTQEEGLTYCSIESFDTLSAAYFHPMAIMARRQATNGDDFFYYETL